MKQESVMDEIEITVLDNKRHEDIIRLHSILWQHIERLNLETNHGSTIISRKTSFSILLTIQIPSSETQQSRSLQIVYRDSEIQFPFRVWR